MKKKMKKANDVKPNAAINFNSESNCKSVLLQSAIVGIGNPEKSQYSTEDRVFLDTGSQRSFITKSVRGKLELATFWKESVISQTFGRNDSNKSALCKLKWNIQIGEVFL